MVILTLNYVLHLIKQETQEMLLQDSSKVSNSRGFIIWVLFNVTISLGDRKIMITLFAHSRDIVYWQTEENYRLYENTLEERVNTCDSILKQLRLQFFSFLYVEKNLYRRIHLCPFSFNLLKCISTGWWYIELVWRTTFLALECCHED